MAHHPAPFCGLPRDSTPSGAPGGVVDSASLTDILENFLKTPFVDAVSENPQDFTAFSSVAISKGVNQRQSHLAVYDIIARFLTGDFSVADIVKQIIGNLKSDSDFFAEIGELVSYFAVSPGQNRTGLTGDRKE